MAIQSGRFHSRVLNAWRIGPILILLLVSFAHTHAGEIKLAWDPSPSPDVGGYKVHYGLASGSYSDVIDAGDQTSVTVADLNDGATYYFAATTYNTTRTSESGFSNEIYAPVPSLPRPVASFSASTLSGTAPLAVTFEDTSTGMVTQRHWDLGNDSWADSAIASTSYVTPGTYSVMLTVTGPGGSDTASKTVTVTAPAAPPVADFSAGVTTGLAPMTIDFNDISTGNMTSWSWKFGDGGSSTARNPSHEYSMPGSYTVTLTVSGPSGSDTKTKPEYITVVSGPSGGGESGISGLVAAYGFDEVSGGKAVDASGKQNHGTITEAKRGNWGRFGRALLFDGVNDWVTVSDSSSLDLISGMTVEAWVYPTVVMNLGNTIVVKEDGTANSAYYLYANEDSNRPISGARIGGYQVVSGPSALPVKKWSHLASTYDGQSLRLFVNGNEVARRPQSGKIPVSGGKLRIGGNAIWGEYFTGRIDEVRIYNRALSQAEIVADANTAVAMSTPPKYRIGDEAIEEVADSNPQGTAEAFEATAATSATLTQIQVYLDESSTATKLIAGIYSDASGHPGTRLANGTLSALEAGAWNTVPLPPIDIVGGERYWIAILGANGELSFRVNGGSSGMMETSKSTALNALPKTWRTGTAYGNGPISAFGAGY